MILGIKRHVFTAVMGVPAGLVAGVVDQTTSPGGSTDLSWLAPFGAAAPFAALALWQMNRAQAKLDKMEADHKAEKYDADRAHRNEVERLRDENRALRERSETRERELVVRFGNIIYDSALLYKEGNTAVASIAQTVSNRQTGSPLPPAPPDDPALAQVLEAIHELTDTMNRGTHADETPT